MTPGPIRRRRTRLTSATSPYAPIIATNPDLLVPLKYASTDADGQILYEDAALSTIVDANGEPIGGVDWSDNTVAVEQTTNAGRPVWGGDNTGAVWDGVDDHLIAGDVGDFDYLHERRGCIAADIAVDDANADDIYILFSTSDTIFSDRGIQVSWDNRGSRDQFLRLAFLHDGGVEDNLSGANAITDTSRHSIAVVWDFSTVEFWVDGALHSSHATVGTPRTGPAHQAATIGAEGQVANAPASGSMSYLAVYDRGPSQTDADFFGDLVL